MSNKYLLWFKDLERFCDNRSWYKNQKNQILLYFQENLMKRINLEDEYQNYYISNYFVHQANKPWSKLSFLEDKGILSHLQVKC